MSQDQFTLDAFMKAIQASCPDLSEEQTAILIETFAPIYEFLQGTDGEPRLDLAFKDFMSEGHRTAHLHRHLASLYDEDPDGQDMVAFPLGSPKFVTERPAWEEPDVWQSLMFENFMGNADPHKLDQQVFSDRFQKILEAHEGKMFHPRIKQVLEKEMGVQVSVAHWCNGHVSAWHTIATQQRIDLIDAVRRELGCRLEPYKKKNEPFEIGMNMYVDAFERIYGALVFWAIGLIADGYDDTDLCKAICGILKVYHKHPIVGANVHDPNLWMVLAH
jgi:hypothetical protein